MCKITREITKKKQDNEKMAKIREKQRKYQYNKYKASHGIAKKQKNEEMV